MEFPEKVKAAIFDVDDTLLDNQAGVEFGTIHELTRLRAVHQIAKKHNLPTLLTLTEEENYAAFHRAKTHSIGGALWEILYLKGIVSSDEINPDHELLKEIITLKDNLHVDVLRQYGRAVVGAVELVHSLAVTYKIKDKLALASSGIRRDINIFLDELTDLRQFFPDQRIIAGEDIPHGFGKPHPEPFNRAFAALGLPESDRKNTLVFEDDPRGIVSAKKAGLFVCAITTRLKADDPVLLAAQPDIIIANYNDFIAGLG